MNDQSTSKTTSDHDTIRKWVEERGGVPATVGSTKKKGEVGLLRIKFPEAKQEKSMRNLEEISWEEFFKKFDESELEFLYQEKTKEGDLSRFFKFVKA